MSKICGIFTYNKKAKNMKKLSLLLVAVVLFQSCTKDDIPEITPKATAPVSAVAAGELGTDSQLDSRIVNSTSLKESIVKGKIVYTSTTDANGNSCMSCHVSKDGYDIALFNNIDSIPLMNRTFHRALKHVSVQESIDVMNYIKSLTKSTVTPRNSIKNVYQPGAEVVTEGQFATSIGLNNSVYTLNQINAWDFTQIKVPITLPSWIDTASINDIMPDKPMQLLKDGNLQVKTAYTIYLDNPTDANFVRFKRTVFNNLTDGQKHPGEHGYSDFKESYNTMKWMSSAYIQHVIRYRNGQFGPFNIYVDGRLSDEVNESVLDPIWFAGDIARRSLDNGSVAEQLPERNDIRSTWLFLGWIGNYGKTANFETKYIAEALISKNFQYLTQAVIMKSLVNRPDNQQALYDDLRSAGRNIDPNTGNFDKCLDFMLTYVNNKIVTNPMGARVTGNDKMWSLEDLNTARGFINEKAGGSKASLLTKIDQIIAAVNAM
jgi:hypothetical protein